MLCNKKCLRVFLEAKSSTTVSRSMLSRTLCSCPRSWLTSTLKLKNMYNTLLRWFYEPIFLFYFFSFLSTRQMLLRQHLPWKSRPWLAWSELNWELAKSQVVDALSEAVTDSLQVTPYSDDQRRVQCRRVELPCQASDRDAKKVWETKMSQPIDQEYKATPATSGCGCGWSEVESDGDNKRCLPNCFQ